MEHPLSKLWPNIVTGLEKAPDTVTLPREEVIRLCKAMYVQGVAGFCLALTALDQLCEERDDDDKEGVRESFMIHTAEWLAENRTNSCEQMLATMRAHEIKKDA